MPDKNLRGKTAVVGVGHTKYGKLFGHTAEDLGIWALDEALNDCGLQRKDLDGLIVSRIPDYQIFCEMTHISPEFVHISPGQGRMAGTTIQLAVAAIAAGMCNTIALVYGNNGRSSGAKYGGKSDKYGGAGGGEWSPYGMTSPGAVHAMMFARHQKLYGTTVEQLAHVSKTFRKHATLNPNAVMQTLITSQDYLSSRYIVEPLRLFDYCLINDGGVALIISTAERAKDTKKTPVFIRGFAQQSSLIGSGMPSSDFWYEPLSKIAAETEAMSGTKKGDLSAAMIYDNFSPTVLFALEGCGFCEVGESGDFVADGKLRLGGELPTNTNGGHLSESYMQGWGLNCEAVRQIRGECGQRQIKDAELVQYICAAPISTSIIYGKDPK